MSNQWLVVIPCKEDCLESIDILGFTTEQEARMAFEKHAKKIQIGTSDCAYLIHGKVKDMANGKL